MEASFSSGANLLYPFHLLLLLLLLLQLLLLLLLILVQALSTMSYQN